MFSLFAFGVIRLHSRAHVVWLCGGAAFLEPDRGFRTLRGFRYHCGAWGSSCCLWMYVCSSSSAFSSSAAWRSCGFWCYGDGAVVVLIFRAWRPRLLWLLRVFLYERRSRGRLGRYSALAGWYPHRGDFAPLGPCLVAHGFRPILRLLVGPSIGMELALTPTSSSTCLSLAYFVGCFLGTCIRVHSRAHVVSLCGEAAFLVSFRGVRTLRGFRYHCGAWGSSCSL